MEEGAAMARPILTSSKEDATISLLVTHTPNKATRTPNNRLHHSLPTAGDSNKEATKTDMVGNQRVPADTVRISCQEIVGDE